MTQVSPESADQWRIESESIVCGLTEHVYDLALSVELPAKLHMQEAACSEDPRFSEEFEEWFEFLCERDLLLPIERSCDSEGLLLHWDMRAVRLHSIPAEQLGCLHFFFERCPRHVRAILVQHVYWLVVFERVQRRGTAVWSVADLHNDCREEAAFFRPNRLVIRGSAH